MLHQLKSISVRLEKIAERVLPEFEDVENSFYALMIELDNATKACECCQDKLKKVTKKYDDVATLYFRMKKDLDRK